MLRKLDPNDKALLLIPVENQVRELDSKLLLDYVASHRVLIIRRSYSRVFLEGVKTKLVMYQALLGDGSE